MNFKKAVTTEVFDCTAFNAGDLYYMHWRDSGLTDVKAIYLCDDVDTEGNQILLKEIVVLKGNPLRLTLRIGNEDLQNIVEIKEVMTNTKFNLPTGRWTVVMEEYDGT